MEIIAQSSAKVNLLLKVVSKRPDGYHEIRTAFQMIDLSDTLIVEPLDSGDAQIVCDSQDVPTDGRNLAAKAAHKLKAMFEVAQGARITIVKRIPVSAGLGGGSSNAAAALKALARLWRLKVPNGEMERIALSIGADVPFFLNGPCALGEGVGEKLTPVKQIRSFPILLVKPDFGVSAAEAYKNSMFNFAPFKWDPGLVESFRSGDPGRIAPLMENDLEPWVMSAYPQLKKLAEKTQNTGAVKVMMSGSGPTLFALYRNETEREAARAAMAGEAEFVTMARTIC